MRVRGATGRRRREEFHDCDDKVTERKEKMNELMQIGNRLSVCRQNKNMTQEELAGRLGITPQALSKWERGVSFPDISMLADISRLLEVSADYLLGVGTGTNKEDSGREVQREICNNLNMCLEAPELVFGVDLVPLFVDNKFVPKVMDIRKRLSRSGILMPIVRIRDEKRLQGQEFMIMAYQNVLYSEVLNEVNDKTVEYMLGKLEEMVRDRYYEILNPDLIKNLVDSLKEGHPALIEGVAPEKIPYSLLTEVMKRVLAKGMGANYLPKVIEVMDVALYYNPRLDVDALVEKVMGEIEREDNFWVVMRNR